MGDTTDIKLEIASLKARVTELERQAATRGNVFPLPASKGSNQLRLIMLARRDPDAAKAEARRMARADTLKKRRAI